MIKKFLRKRGILINSFIDDFILWASTRSQALFHLEWTKKVLVWLGFKLNLKKTSESPVQCLIYLGVQLDLESLTLSLPQEKIVKLRSLCNATSAKQKVSRADLEGLIGLVTFSYSVILLGRMFATPLIVWMNEHTSMSARHAKTSVTSSLRDLLKPFCEGNFLEQKVSFKTLVPELVLMTDASDFGWSGVILPYVIRDIWSGLDQYRSINEREMLAVTFFVHFMRSTLAGKNVVIHTDSEVVFFCLNRMDSLRSPQMMDLVRQFLSLCMSHTITFEVRHIPGMLNVLADVGSRDKLSVTDNCLDQETLLWCFKVAGLDSAIAVDLCATRANTRCSQYVSPCVDFHPNCVGWDVKAVDWSQFQQIYLFPPVSILPDLLSKITKFSGKGLLIAPFQNGPALAQMVSRARLKLQLPASYFLFQMKDGEVERRRKYYDYWMWVL